MRRRTPQMNDAGPALGRTMQEHFNPTTRTAAAVTGAVGLVRAAESPAARRLREGGDP